MRHTGKPGVGVFLVIAFGLLAAACANGSQRWEAGSYHYDYYMIEDDDGDRHYHHHHHYNDPGGDGDAESYTVVKDEFGNSHHQHRHRHDFAVSNPGYERHHRPRHNQLHGGGHRIRGRHRHRG